MSTRGVHPQLRIAIALIRPGVLKEKKRSFLRRPFGPAQDRHPSDSPAGLPPCTSCLRFPIRAERQRALVRASLVAPSRVCDDNSLRSRLRDSSRRSHFEAGVQRARLVLSRAEGRLCRVWGVPTNLSYFQARGGAARERCAAEDESPRRNPGATSAGSRHRRDGRGNRYPSTSPRRSGQALWRGRGGRCRLEARTGSRGSCR